MNLAKKSWFWQGGGFQTISLVGVGQIFADNNGAHITLTLSGQSPIEGDCVILFGGHNYRAASIYGPGTAGYTQIAYHDPGVGVQFGVWYKFMGSSPDATVIGYSTAAAQDSAAYGAYILRGVSPTVVDQTTVVVDGGSGTVPDCGAIVTQTPGAWVLALCGYNAATPQSSLSGYSNFLSAGDTDTNSFAAASGTKVQTTPGSVDPPGFTSQIANNYIAMTVAIKPASL